MKAAECAGAAAAAALSCRGRRRLNPSGDQAAGRHRVEKRPDARAQPRQPFRRAGGLSPPQIETKEGHPLATASVWAIRFVQLRSPCA
jgi:hypothetical protein